ncbi:MAG TPA: hypothetical protein VNP96_03875 [Solirubrobacterales bacterium]|nr:hypothetical protein [Solirubrobacterales bacterium]
MDERARQLEWEKRWSRPAGLAALAAVAFVAASLVVASQIGGSDGDSEFLRNVDAHEAARLISGILQAIGVSLLAVPLYFLFRAANARSDGMRGQLVGIVVAGPLFLAAASILTGISTVQAASDFVSDQVPQLLSKGVALGSDRADDLASDALGDASLRPLAAGFGIGGQIGFVVGMFYTALHAMRSGLLTRFWGSLGMALGAVSFIFFQFAILWFIYLGLLLAGWVPGGRPPAWASGEAEPWPTPGEKAAADLPPPPEEPEQKS